MTIEVQPATEEQVAYMKSRLVFGSMPAHYRDVEVAQLIKLIECQKVELADRAETIRLLLNDQNETVEQETAR